MIYQEILQKGAERRTQEMGLKLLEVGVDVDLISYASSLTPEEIRQVTAGEDESLRNGNGSSN